MTAVLFPTQFGQVLQPSQPAQLLQGFLNIMNTEGSQNGTLSKAQLDSYSRKQFFAVDSNSAVAGYMNQNFAAIAKLDGDANSISTADLVSLRQGLPTPTPPQPPQPPVQQPPFYNIFFQMMQMMMKLMMGFLGQR